MCLTVKLLLDFGAEPTEMYAIRALAMRNGHARERMAASRCERNAVAEIGRPT